MAADSTPIAYDLARLFGDQDRVFVEESLPALLTWVPGRGTRPRESPFEFEVASSAVERPTSRNLRLIFRLPELEAHHPGLREQIRRWRTGRTLHLERHAELGALGLALAAISAFLPGRRVITQNRFVSPDLLIDATPGALKGIEVAGRSTGGRSAVVAAAVEKRPRLHRPDVAEAWLSLWCARPRVAIWMKERG